MIIFYRCFNYLKFGFLPIYPFSFFCFRLRLWSFYCYLLHLGMFHNNVFFVEMENQLPLSSLLKHTIIPLIVSIKNNKYLSISSCISTKHRVKCLRTTSLGGQSSLKVHSCNIDTESLVIDK